MEIKFSYFLFTGELKREEERKKTHFDIACQIFNAQEVTKLKRSLIFLKFLYEFGRQVGAVNCANSKNNSTLASFPPRILFLCFFAALLLRA